MKVNLTLHCNVTCCNGSINIEIYDKDQFIYSGKDFEPGQMKIELAVDWPTTINIITSNKAPGDHEIDSNSNIVKDKAIEVVALAINNFHLHQDLIDKIFVCRKDDCHDDTHENWWGFNGKIKLELAGSSPMRYMLNLNNEFQMNRLSWKSNE